MKATVSRPELVSLIGKIQGIVPSKAAIPILANILIEASGQELVISVTDLTVSMRIQIQASIEEEGAITLPARRFFQLIRELTAPEVEISSSTDEIAFVKSGSSQFRLNGMHKSEFPALPTLLDAHEFTIESKILKEMLVRSSFAAARDDSRHVLNGSLMQVQNDQATFIGTDGKRLAKVMTRIDLESTLNHHFLIPLKAVEEIIKILDFEKEVKCHLLDDKIAIDLDSLLLTTKLLSGKYPDTDRVIPTNSSITVNLHREELMTLLKQVSLFTSDKNHSILFIFNPGELHLVASSSDIGEGKSFYACRLSR